MKSLLTSLMELAGAALVVFGITLVSVPAAIIVAGVALVTVGALL